MEIQMRNTNKYFIAKLNHFKMFKTQNCGTFCVLNWFYFTFEQFLLCFAFECSEIKCSIYSHPFNSENKYPSCCHVNLYKNLPVDLIDATNSKKFQINWRREAFCYHYTVKWRAVHDNGCHKEWKIKN